MTKEWQESMWTGSPFRLQNARSEAWVAKINDEPLSAHSIMLSAYISIRGSKDYNRLLHPIFGLWHALWMLVMWKELDHNQLDVLIQFLLKCRASAPWFFGHRKARRQEPTESNCELLAMAARELQYARDSLQGKPHQIALAYITLAEVFDSVGGSEGLIGLNVDQALGLEKQIRTEKDQLQALRQLVRIKRKAGELCFKSDSQLGIRLLNESLMLARGEADCADQVSKIKVVLNRINPR
jgi:hypothetical protein